MCFYVWESHHSHGFPILAQQFISINKRFLCAAPLRYIEHSALRRQVNTLRNLLTLLRIQKWAWFCLIYKLLINPSVFIPYLISLRLDLIRLFRTNTGIKIIMNKWTNSFCWVFWASSVCWCQCQLVCSSLPFHIDILILGSWRVQLSWVTQKVAVMPHFLALESPANRSFCTT